ncbi:MAG: formylglycine-generating enzyme family protein [Blastochloris sp.]|nr:formylglycine-generating enzyme family protein [Blastochloris sp.]
MTTRLLGTWLLLCGVYALHAEGPVGSEFRLGLKDRVGIDFVWVEPVQAYVGKYEVTQEQYEILIGQNPSIYKRPQHPVIEVTWAEAMVFCKKLTVIARHTGAIPANWEFTLPTEKQWEVFVGNAQLSDAVTSDVTLYIKERSNTEPVGSLRPNNYGLHDVRGNVWEWCLDWRKDREGPVSRGASYNTRDPRDLEVSCSKGGLLYYDKRIGSIGFRVLLSPAPKRWGLF